MCKSPTFEKEREKGFQLAVARGIPQSWVRKVIEGLEDLPEDEQTPLRRKGCLHVPSGPISGQAFIKVFHHTSTRHRKWRRRAPIQRLRRRYADHEGRALRHLAAAGIPVPKLLFYGEEWRFGVRQRGVVATENLPAPTLFEVLAEEIDSRWLGTYSETLAGIHAAGLSHGDAHSRNFLVQGTRLVAIDLENSRALTHKKRTSDLVTMVSSILQSTGCEKLASCALASYESAGGGKSRISIDGLIKLGHVIASSAA